jgi:hypothetical protein
MFSIYRNFSTWPLKSNAISKGGHRTGGSTDLQPKILVLNILQTFTLLSGPRSWGLLQWRMPQTYLKSTFKERVHQEGNGRTVHIVSTLIVNILYRVKPFATPWGILSVSSFTISSSPPIHWRLRSSGLRNEMLYSSG